MFKLLNGEEVEMTSQEIAEMEAFQASLPPGPVPNRILKADIWRRATDEEAEAMSLALASAPVRLREMYAAAVYIDINDPEFPALRAGIEGAVGVERVDVILEPTEVG